jgi:hypothetical protein
MNDFRRNGNPFAEFLEPIGVDRGLPVLGGDDDQG